MYCRLPNTNYAFAFTMITLKIVPSAHTHMNLIAMKNKLGQVGEGRWRNIILHVHNLVGNLSFLHDVTQSTSRLHTK